MTGFTILMLLLALALFFVLRATLRRTGPGGRSCPHCGATATLFARYCPRCGRKLG